MKKTKPPIAILGAGHGGMAMAGHLAILGHNVRLFNRGEERLWGVKSSGTIEVKGEVEGRGKVQLATNQIGEAIEGAELIMVVVPASGHRWIAEQIAPFLRDGQIIVLNPGRTFGALEFRLTLDRLKVRANVIIAEAQTFIYASRAIGPAEVKIFSIKETIPVASVRAHLIPKLIYSLRRYFPQFVPGDNILKTSFDNIGSVFHPCLCILNTGWIEYDIDFQFYHEGATQSVAKVLEIIDAERVAIAEALGIRAITALQWLYLAYSTSGKSLFDAIRKNPGYRGILAPKTLQMRYLEEDVPFSLVPIASIGKMLGKRAKTIEALIHLASQINACDYWKTGRTVERLGIEKYTLRQLRLLAIGEFENKTKSV